MLVLVVGVLFGLGIWLLTAPKETVAFRVDRSVQLQKESRRRKSRADLLSVRLSQMGRVIWLSGVKFPLFLMKPVQLVFAGLFAVVGVALLHNVILAVLVGLLGFTAPYSLLRSIAVAQWRKADRQAYILVNTLRFSLPVHGHPLNLLRRLLLELDDPLRGWLQEAIALEAVGRSAEDGIHELGVRLGHTELQLFAEIIRADRHDKPASDLLGELLEAWTDRIRSEQARLGKLSSTKKLANIMIGGPCLVFVLMPLVSPKTAAIFTSTVAGEVVAIIGGLLMLGAVVISRRSLASGEEVRV